MRLASRFLVTSTLAVLGLGSLLADSGILAEEIFTARIPHQEKELEFSLDVAEQTRKHHLLKMEREEPAGMVLSLHPQKTAEGVSSSFGMNSAPLELEKDLGKDQPWRVEAVLKNAGIEKGSFAFSMYCYDAAGKPLKQIVFSGFSEKSTPGNWRRVVALFGPGTARPLPAATQHVRLRFSFYEPSGDCRGQVQVKQVLLAPHQTPGNSQWPAEIVANVGDMQVRFESRSFWTLYRIAHQGTRIGLDRYGSHYGSVALFPGVGFIGTGHTENEDEQILDLKLQIDGHPIEIPPAEVTCKTIQLEKTSRIRSLLLKTTITVEENAIREAVTLTANESTPVSLIYHFMHPWLATCEEFYAETLNGEKISGSFVGDRGQRIDQPTRWSALFDSATGTGAVTYVVNAPADPDHWRTRYWDIDNVYRKHYFVTFMNQTIPANREFSYEIQTIPFSALPGDWKSTAEKIAAAVKRDEVQRHP